MNFTRLALVYLWLVAVAATARGISQLFLLYVWGNDGTFLPVPLYLLMIGAGIAVYKYMYSPLRIAAEAKQDKRPP